MATVGASAAATEASVEEPGTATGSALRWADRHRDDLLVAGMFAVARVVYVGVLGVRMDLAFLGFAPHLPDLGLLQRRLLETVFYEHTQPPGYPFLVGALLKASPFPDGITFHVVHLILGLGLALLVRRMSLVLGLGRVAALGAVALVVTNPALVSIEFSANYDLPTIVLSLVLVLSIVRYVADGSPPALAAVTATAGAMALIRTVFHPGWYVLLVVGLVAMRRPTEGLGRRTVIVVAVPAIVLGAFVVKNQALYGEATLTTWTGPSLTKIAGSAATPAQRTALIADGTVSPLFGRPVFYGYAEYDDAVAPCTPDRPGVPVLGQSIRQTNGSPNLNFDCFLPVYRQQGADARAYLRKEPARFVGAQLVGAQMFFEPALPIVFTRNQTLSDLPDADTFFAWTLYPRLRLDPVAYSDWGGLRVLARGGIDLLPTILALDVGVAVYGISRLPRLVRQRRRTGGGLGRARLVGWASVGMLCAWVTAIGSTFEINENARYRLLVEPFLLIAMAAVVELAVTAARTHLGQGVSGR